MKKNFFLLLTLPISLSAVSQSISFSNLSAANPRTNIVYIGVENKLLLDPAGRANSATALSGSVYLLKDTLFIKPVEQGPLTIVIETTDGKQDLLLRAKMLPALKLQLEGHPAGRIVLQRFQWGQKLLLMKDEDNYWSKFRIEKFGAAINNVSVVNNGAVPGADLADAIKKSAKGSMLNITMLELVDDATGIRQFVKTNIRMSVN